VVEKQLHEVLREAGLDDQSIRLIIENKLIAETVASFSKKLCEKFSSLTKTAAEPPIGNYRGKLDFNRLPDTVATIRARGEKVTQRAVCKELGWNYVTLSRLMARYPELKKAFKIALYV